MTHGREKRLLLGVLALLTPLPLPFNEVIGWGSLALYLAAAILFLRRAWRDEPEWLSFRAMNVLGLAYLPFLLADVTVAWRGRPLPPLVHLAMFALLVKLFGLQREKDKWHAFFGVFFLFLAAMGSSVHPSVTLYLLAWTALALYALMRFAALELFTRHLPREAARPLPLGGFLVGGLAFIVALAVPLFLAMPRLRTPYVLLPVGAPGAVGRVSGSQEDLSLDFIGRIRLDRSVALRARYDGAPPRGHELRLKAGAYDSFDGVVWRSGHRRGDRPDGGGAVQRGPEGLFRVAPGRVVAWMDVWLEPLGGAVLPMPVDGVGLDFPFSLQVPAVAVDSEGVVSLYARPSEGVQYRAALSDGRELAIPPLARRGPALPPAAADEADLDATAITPRIRELATQAAGEGDELERARRLEGHLLSEYGYTLDTLGQRGENRVEGFLFTHRRGHCELFASALVLMLRSQGIPARLVSGFLGGEHNPIEGYYVVRQSNAHAWVEARVGEAGWTTFDPTPPEGRPQAGEGGLLRLASQLYDFVVFRWDRYVLTYSFGDQVGTLLGLRDLWLDLARWLARRQRPPAASPAPTPASSSDPAEVAEEPSDADSPVGLLSLAAALALFLVFAWRRRRRFTAVLAYRRLRERLAGEPDRDPATLAPHEVSRRLAIRFPTAAEPVERVVALYLEESFGGRELSPSQRAELREAAGLARRARSAPAA